jgi:hypothetical protein
MRRATKKTIPSRKLSFSKAKDLFFFRNNVNILVDVEEVESEIRPKTPVSLFSPSQRSFDTFQVSPESTIKEENHFQENDPVTGIDLNGLDDFEDV